jgi:hypothetical protein
MHQRAEAEIQLNEAKQQILALQAGNSTQNEGYY